MLAAGPQLGGLIFLVILLSIPIAFFLWGRNIAESKGLSPLWGCVAAIFYIPAIILLYVMPAGKSPEPPSAPGPPLPPRDAPGAGRHCPQCGRLGREGARFCQDCGASL